MFPSDKCQNVNSKMAAKLVIHKFEEGNNFKSLFINIYNKDSDQEAEFGDWLEGKTDNNKREYTKPRLVVKLVSGDHIDSFSLELCAKKLVDVEKSYDGNMFENQYVETSPVSKDVMFSSENNDRFKDTTDNNINFKMNESVTFLNPLEYSIEKVKANNARIMENIHMLNRTLNYTKKKEILDIICPKPQQSFPCETCGKNFVYETGLKRHYSMRHAVTEPHPRWQVVWTCTECFQVWPRYDLAIKHTIQCCSRENSECIREIKTSSLLQCEFCEQVFTNIPRLLKHSKTHTVANNYECRACNVPFISYRSAEQHWLSCSWVNNFYKFSLPKMLLCNVCDRKFKNYEQLYNHRYKVGHFINKSHIDQNGISLSIMLYQCELCSLWYNMEQALLIHKKQHHSRLDTAI